MDENQLKKWYVDFLKKRDNILKIRGLVTPYEIAEYFTYSNLKEKEPDFCPLFKTNEKCHDLPEDELICYWCACPFYDYDYFNEEEREYGRCRVNSIYGKRNEEGYWDCSNCLLPHRKKFVVKSLLKYK